MNDNGSGKHIDEADTERRQAVESARLAFDGIREEIEQVNALVDVVEEIGEAVIQAAHDDLDPEEQFDAGAVALDPHGDDNDGLRAGLRWIIEACSQGIPDYEDVDASPPRRRSKAKKKARSH